ncbi:MAG: hypothetical protein JW820_05045 [Spirochaetales bacterium]|nr:hypothetical protein [Spirochaetales bacterium]
MDVLPASAEGFVRRLLANPALEGFAPLHKEEQILAFLEANARALYPTLSGSRFFPGRRWPEILSMLRRALETATDGALLPWLEAWVHGELDLSFVEAIAPRGVPEQALKREIRELVGRLLAKLESRRALTGPLTAIQLALDHRYLEACFREPGYVHFELTKLQRLRLELPGLGALTAVTLLLRPSVQLFTEARGASGRRPSMGVVTPQLASTALASLRSQLRVLPAALLRGAVYSNCSFLQDRRIEATARWAAIFSARARSYSPHVRVDRGAGTPDASWFSVARRNQRHYGFDINMLDELYRIAVENGW